METCPDAVGKRYPGRFFMHMGVKGKNARKGWRACGVVSRVWRRPFFCLIVKRAVWIRNEPVTKRDFFQYYNRYTV